MQKNNLARTGSPCKDAAVADLVASLRAKEPFTDFARLFHAEVEAALNDQGWAVQREVVVPDRGDGRRGRVDLVASRRGVTVAIELDSRSPRGKSIVKLTQLDGHRLILLRGAAQEFSVAGISVAGLEVTP